MDQTSLRFYLKNHPFKIIPAKKAGEQPSQFVTCPMRLAFCYFETPKDRKTGPSYEACGIIPPEADLTVAKQMFVNAATAKFGAGFGSMNLKTPVKSQKVLFDKGYEGFANDPNAKYFQFGSKFQPAVFDRNKNPLPVTEVYSGAWVLALLRTYTYDTDGNKGVGFGIVSVQKLCDDARFESADKSYGFDEIPEHGAPAAAGAPPATAQAPAQNIPGF